MDAGKKPTKPLPAGLKSLWEKQKQLLDKKKKQPANYKPKSFKTIRLTTRQRVHARQLKKAALANKADE